MVIERRRSFYDLFLALKNNTPRLPSLDIILAPVVKANVVFPVYLSIYRSIHPGVHLSLSAARALRPTGTSLHTLSYMFFSLVSLGFIYGFLRVNLGLSIGFF